MTRSIPAMGEKSKRKKKRSIKRDYMKEVEEQAQAWSKGGGGGRNLHTTQEKDRRKITQFSSVVLGEQ